MFIPDSQFPDMAVIKATPITTLVDENVTIKLSGFDPGSKVTVRSYLPEPGLHFEAHGHFVVNVHGEVSLTDEPSIEGTYTGKYNDCRGNQTFLWGRCGSRHLEKAMLMKTMTENSIWVAMQLISYTLWLLPRCGTNGPLLEYDPKSRSETRTKILQERCHHTHDSHIISTQRPSWYDEFTDGSTHH